MKPTVTALASVLVLSTTLALAQTGSGTVETPGKVGPANDSFGAKGARTTGGSMSTGRSTGSAITTGSAPQDKPNISNSPETWDTSQKVK